MFEFFCLEGRVNAVDHIVVCLLLLLLYLRELLEMFLSVSNKISKTVISTTFQKLRERD